VTAPEPNPEAAAVSAGQAGAWTRRIAPFAGAAVFLLALWALHGELSEARLAAFAESLTAISLVQIAASIGLTVVSYGLVANVDWLALRYTPARLPWRRAALSSVAAYAIANVAGFGAFSANAVRLRLYSAWGLDAPIVATVAVASSCATYLGATAALGTGLLLGAPMVSQLLGPPTSTLMVVGAALLALVLLVASAAGRGPEELKIAGAVVRRPPRRWPYLQIAAAATDWFTTAAVLWALLPPDSRPEFIAFAPAFILASVAGAVSGLPAGIGAFDVAIVFAAPPGAEEGYAAALIVYRLIFFLGPLAFAAGGLAWSGREPIGRTLSLSRRRFDAAAFAIAPMAFSLLSFAAGAMTLASVATPSVAERLHAVSRWAPHAVIEASHFLASLAGVLLLVVAGGLRRRLSGAWLLTLALLGGAAMLSLLKGGDWEQAALLAALFAVLAVSRPAFYRKDPMLSLKLFSPWTAAIALTLAAMLWVGEFAYRHVEYRDELWWTFLLDADAPRSLRAAAGAAALAAAVFAWRWMQHSPPKPEAVAFDAARIASALEGADSGHADANLAFLGDKRFLASPSGRSFIQYGVHGRSWIAMGEPAGLASERRELLWRFREEADRHGAWPVFYSVRKEALPELIEVGLAVQKVGEAAIVPLAEFALEGSARAPLRHARNRAGREGAAFEVVSPPDVAALLPELRAISDAWLEGRHGKELGFTLGRFDEAYLLRFPIALVRVAGRPVAFANIWTTADKRELSIDLMRYAPTAPDSVMDYLFIELALWAKAAGYRELDLGMAPLAGLEGRRLAPLLTRLGAFVFDHAEAIYGFEGLRAYKEKFDPVWEPLYLAAPSRLILPVALGDVAMLTRGGLLRTLTRGD
jgi:phosphatidylglycerol lysyltransferase